MPKFEVSSIVRLELNAKFMIQAKDQEEAESLAESVTESLVIKWNDTARSTQVKTAKGQKKVEVEWDETDHTCEVESVDEQ